MNDRNRFEQAEREPVSQAEGVETSAPAQDGTGNEAKPASPAYQQLRDRYVERINDLTSDALERNALDIFTDVVAWKMASIANACGPRATGQIVRLIGFWIEHLAHLDEAQREAAAQAEAGHAPH